MLASSLPPSFLDTYRLSASSQGCHALSMVISFLFRSILLSSSRVYSKNGPEYLWWGADYYYYIYSFTPLRVFHTSVSWCFLNVVFATASLFKSPLLFSVFWPILKMELFGWSSRVLLFPSPPSLLTIFRLLYQELQLQMILPSLSCPTVFFSSLARSRYLPFFFRFLLISFNFVWPRSDDPIVSQNLEQMLGFAYTICSYGRI